MAFEVVGKSMAGSASSGLLNADPRRPTCSVQCSDSDAWFPVISAGTPAKLLVVFWIDER
jgi:hypothetical protein